MDTQITQIDNWKAGQTGHGVAKVGYDSRRTKPPKPYTEATLLFDMKSAAKFLSDPAMREALKEAEGLGTPATRAATIEKLKSAGYIKQAKTGSTIRSTPEGQSVVNGLPNMLVDPGTTALWEEMLSKISRGEVTMDRFMKMIESEVGKLVAGAKGGGISIPGKSAGGGTAGVAMEQPCPVCAGKLLMGDRGVQCEKGDFTVYREVATLKLKDEHLIRLLKYGRVGPLDGFFSAAKKKRFSANLVLEKDGKAKFDFSK